MDTPQSQPVGGDTSVIVDSSRLDELESAIAELRAQSKTFVPAANATPRGPALQIVFSGSQLEPGYFGNLSSTSDFYIPENLTSGDRTEYIAYIAGQLRAYYQISRELYSTGKDPSGALRVLPVGLLMSHAEELTQALPNDTEHVLMQTHLQKLPLQSPEIEPRSVRFLGTEPRNESSLIETVLFGISDLPRHTLQAEIARMKYTEKSLGLDDALNTSWQKAVRTNCRYEIEVTCEVSDLLDLLCTGPLSVQMQTLSPMSGYDVPKEIVDIDMHDIFEASYDAAVSVHSKLQADYGLATAQYACLLGHRVRFTMNTNAQQISEQLRDTWIYPKITPHIATRHPSLNIA
ncbi:MAG: hypothetical protein AAF413_00670 [Patescibacteria group bacterium]